MRIIIRTAILFAASSPFVGLGLSRLAPHVYTAAPTLQQSAPAGTAT